MRKVRAKIVTITLVYLPSFMPQISTHSITTDCTLIRWQITESEANLAAQLALTADEQLDLNGIAHPGQRIEWLACRVALKTMVEASGLCYNGLRKDIYGKPHLLFPGGELPESATDSARRGESTDASDRPDHISLSDRKSVV